MVRFGPSGNSEIFYSSGYKTSMQAPMFLNKVGLELYEYSFGRGYTMILRTANLLGEEAKKYGIEISVHAPYYINLANTDEEMIQKSFNYILKGFEYLRAMGGKKLVVHVASQGKLLRPIALNKTKENLIRLIKLIYEKGYDDMFMCLETMGKMAQIGTYEEIIDLCTLDKVLLPTFDFGHINCIMQGGLKTEEDYEKIFKYSFDKLGEFKTKNCHIHFSKIEFGKFGEVRHLNYNDSGWGPNFRPLANVLHKLDLSPTIICESKDYMAEDAKAFKFIYENS